jgi:hypothetical protein
MLIDPLICLNILQKRKGLSLFQAPTHRKNNAKNRFFSLSHLPGKTSFILSDDIWTDVQARPCPFVFFFGGERELENPFPDLSRDAGTGIDQSQ